jgi:prepilin-type N-terminal cleavage/methylation domain-containing protein
MKRSGFTLMEVLVTLVIVVMFSTAVYAVFLRSIVDTHWVGQAMEAGRRGQSLLRMLERDLTACAASSEEVPHFVGSVDTMGFSSLSFIAAADAGSAAGGAPADLVRVSYIAVPNEDADSEEVLKLYRKEERRAGLTIDTEEEEYVLLDDGVKQFDLEYFDGAGWRTVWAEGGVPRVVRLALVLVRRVQVSVSGPATEQEFPFTAVIPVPVHTEGEV